MESSKRVLKGIITGAKDAIYGIISIRGLTKDRSKDQVKSNQPITTTTLSKRRKRQEANRVQVKTEGTTCFIYDILKCCALNGSVFMFIIFCFSYLLLPGLHILTDTIFISRPEMASLIWSWLNPVLSKLFDILWVIPYYFLSSVICCLWYQDIADCAYRKIRGRPQFVCGLSKWIADNIFSWVVQMLFLFQSNLVERLPVSPVSQVASIVHMSLLYSFYTFEYKWINMGWELHKRLSYIETNWPYFIGFGLPLAILTSLTTGFVIRGIIFSIFFPLFIISGNNAIPLTGTCEYRLRLFSVVVYLANTLGHHFKKLLTMITYFMP